MLDYVADVEIYACIYPMITLIAKNDKIYAARGIIYEISYYVVILLTGFLLGKTILSIDINYNFYLLLGAAAIFLSFIVLKNTNLEQYYKKINKNNDNTILKRLVKQIRNDKISKNYLLFVFTGEISYYSISSLMITLLTNYLSFTPQV